MSFRRSCTAALIMTAMIVVAVGIGGSAATYRPMATGLNGVVATAHPLASMAGIRILMQGGNAVDAAIAAAATLGLVEPNASSLGGNGVMIMYSSKTDKVMGFNCDGPTPAACTADKLDKATIQNGYKTGMVPGTLAGWAEALEKCGTMTFAEVFAPAIEVAENGFPVTANLSGLISSYADIFRMYPTTAKIYLKPDGTVPKPGDILTNKDLARTLKLIAEKGPDVFFKGELADKIDTFYRDHGGLITREDLSNFKVDWQEPLHTTYRGYDVYTMGASYCGAILLEQLNIVEGFDLGKMKPGSTEALYAMIESTKLALADRDKYIIDPLERYVPEKGLISKEYAAWKRSQIDPDRALDVIVPGNAEAWEGSSLIPASDGMYASITLPESGDVNEPERHTTHISVIDHEGNMAALTQSVGGWFGTCVVVADTGVVFHNGPSFMSFDPDHINYIRPNIRPTNNGCPTLVFKDDQGVMAIGTPGADAQTQTLFQIIANILDFGMDIQSAIEAPRYRTYDFGKNHVRLESRFDEAVVDALKAKGMNIPQMLAEFTSGTGGVQGVVRIPETGALMGGADPRRDGYAIGY